MKTSELRGFYVHVCVLVKNLHCAAFLLAVLGTKPRALHMLSAGACPLCHTLQSF